MRKLIRAFIPVILLGMSMACSEIESQYFKNGVNVSTAEQVASRYGTPHKLRRIDGGGMVWSYFDRGSGTGSFTGYAKSSYCQMYILTFDKDDILRNWEQNKCEA